jgi:hypothetical protein
VYAGNGARLGVIWATGEEIREREEAWGMSSIDARTKLAMAARSRGRAARMPREGRRGSSRGGSIGGSAPGATRGVDGGETGAAERFLRRCARRRGENRGRARRRVVAREEGRQRRGCGAREKPKSAGGEPKAVRSHRRQGKPQRRSIGGTVKFPCQLEVEEGR